MYKTPLIHHHFHKQEGVFNSAVFVSSPKPLALPLSRPLAISFLPNQKRPGSPNCGQAAGLLTSRSIPERQ